VKIETASKSATVNHAAVIANIALQMALERNRWCQSIELVLAHGLPVRRSMHCAT